MVQEFKNSLIVAAVIFLIWTLTSFLCYECGKMFLFGFQSFFKSTFKNDSALIYFLSSTLLTAAQCLTCLMCVKLSPTTSFFSSTPMAVLVIGHVMSTLATNYSMSYIEAASTLAIKLTEPVTTTIAQYLVFKTSISVQTVFSISLITSGSLMFSMTSISDMSVPTGIFLAFMSNVIVTVRNVAIKKLPGSGTNSFPVQLQSNSRIVAVLCMGAAVILVVYLTNVTALPRNSHFIIGAMFVSGVCHVAYSYITTNVILQMMNIVSNSIANIIKRLLLVLVLYLFGQRSATAWNFMGLTIATVGLYVYLLDKVKQHSEESTNFKIAHWSSKYLHRLVIVCLSVTSLYSVINVAHETEGIQFIDSALIQRLNFNPNHNFWKSGDYYMGITEKDPKLAEFLTWRLVDHPEETDLRSKTLTMNVEIIEEAQRVLINLLTDLIGPIKHVMLMEIATYQNKGDPAISAGEVMLLRKMNLTIVYYCETSTCNSIEHMKKEEVISKNFTKDTIAILMQGGGNLVGNSSSDETREKIMNRYPEHRIILLSQSILLHTSSESLMKAQKIYTNRTNISIFLRDRQSLEIAKKHFHGVRLILAPDLAFGLGKLPRQLAPIYDIVWLRVMDEESSKYTLPVFPKHISVHVSDWVDEWKSNVGSRDFESFFLAAFSGINFLQRGRVVVTDRLHGHILSTLLNIPHVLIDNPPYLKLSSFDKSWTASLENTVLINNGTLGLEEALKLLKKYDPILPQVGPVDINRLHTIETSVNITANKTL
ncbi:hypothetical protein Btru_022418 [Bulinus truncatus]|nr:hypothetical protein Btru_022418 [Bulinus truncatus]